MLGVAILAIGLGKLKIQKNHILEREVCSSSVVVVGSTVIVTYTTGAAQRVVVHRLDRLACIV